MNLSDIRIENIKTVIGIHRQKEDKKIMEKRENSGIVIIKRGKISYFQNGIEYVQTPSSVIIVPKGVSYSLYCHEYAPSYVINFDEQTSILGNKIRLVNVANMNSVLDKADNMFRISSLNTPASKLKIMSLIYGIFSNIVDELTMNEQQLKYYEIIKPTIRFIDKNYIGSNIKCDELAKISNISEVYFRRIFTKVYGVSPMRYIEMLKIEKAKELLEVKEISVSEIALTTGFADSSHFCHSFKKITGLSPGNYRKL